MFQFRKAPRLIQASEALPGREQAQPLSQPHHVFGHALRGEFPGARRVGLGLGCFWGAERVFWQREGVVSTAVGYQGGFTPNPTYAEACSGLTGHTEAVQVVYDPEKVSLSELLALFWESHDPTQGHKQGNDVGTQYRSAIFLADEAELAMARASRDAYQKQLAAAGYGSITTDIEVGGLFYYADDDHQQYLSKNPAGYCGLGGTGVSCAIGLGA